MLKLDKTEIWLVVSALVLLASAFLLPNWLTFILTLALAKALVVQGVVIQMRAGLVSFGQGLFFCIGGYSVGMGGAFLNIHDAFVLVALGVAASVGVAAILGLLMTRYRDIFFAMLSLALSMILYGLIVKNQALGSTDGFNVHDVSFLGWMPAGEDQKLVIFVLTVIVAGGIAIALNRYMKSGLGGVNEAIKENEIRVEFLGLSPRWILYANYLFAAGISAVGGAFTALATGHVDPEMAFWTTSGEFVFIALLGGTSHVAAPFIAAVLFALVRTYALELAPHSWQMILGFVLLAIIVFLPKGLWSLVAGKRRAAA
ncbi:MAG: branched-chain amino acid ABC transporter permease [Azoarcus sp.]|nr:branched-chain amino acid ABC transporter permease [Azoarcus sp.]